MHTACIKLLCFFMSPCDFCKNVTSELLSHRLQSPSWAPPTVLLPNPQTASRPCHCWATTTRKHVEKVNFNGRNQIGWPVTLHSHSKDGWSDRIVTRDASIRYSGSVSAPIRSFSADRVSERPDRSKSDILCIIFCVIVKPHESTKAL